MNYIESQYVELKEVVNVDFKKEIVAFTNTDGGEIYVGVTKDGNIIGVEDTEGQMERISNMIRDGIKPDLTAYTSIETIMDQGKSLIKVTVSRGEKRPYHLTDKGLKPSGVYVRHGVTSAPASDEAIRQMIKESDGTTFERARCINQDLTFEYAEKYFKDSNVQFAQNHKKSLRLIDDNGYYTNAALLLSDQCEHIIRCAVYEGTGKTTFKTRKEYSGSILKQMNEAYAFLALNNNLRSSFEGLKRIDYADYPDYALRETLLNAVVHRDYDYSGSIIINIYDDKIEFVSLGGLVKGITLTDIMGGVSQPRNSIIANIFYRLELIESYGTGIKRILESYADCAVEPTFFPAPSSFVVTLLNRNKITLTLYDDTLSQEENVMNLLQAKGKITRKDIETFLKCSAFPARNVINSLLAQNKIIKTGAARATRYTLSK
ncbi:RNA-binding domain-containing protein [Marinisporobacter balticus]|uniref:Putative HTH transcriptional regulator n=1 Tax=Marinisporobacter balticus TaxID=2018667 RepID=A0A4R2K4K3_9FIRM|nr:RNA-binding domain-containing protein [Marinisporobacter balticus]TCO68103.1 putative HTH transcriptional regulator [Marinisporobacter balticus]